MTIIYISIKIIQKRVISIKTVMLVAGGRWQIPIAKKIKDMGYRLVCSNLYPDSAAFKYADESFVADVLDKERNLEFAKKCNIDAVVSDQSDISMETVAYIAESLNLPTNGYEIAKLFHSKVAMREHCKKYGFPSPDFRACKTMEDALEFYEGKDVIVIKPLCSQAARGFYKVTSRDDIIKNFDESLRYSNNENTVIAEEFIYGTEFTIDGIFINGEHHSLSSSIKHHYPHAQHVADEIYFTHHDSRFDMDALKQHNNKLMNTTGARIGLTHNEYMFSDGQFKLVEMSNRGGGNNISGVITPLMSGVDNMGIYIRQALGENITDFKVSPHKERVMLKFFYISDFGLDEGNVIHAIEGLDKVMSFPGVVEVSINYTPGDIIQKASNGTNRPGYYIAYGDSREDLDRLHNKILQTIKVY